MATYGEHHEPGWMRLLRVLARSFRLGRFFGVEVRIYWIAVVLVPLIGFLEFNRALPSALEALVLGLLLTFWLFVIVWTHEMGHILAGRRFGIPTPLITLSPLGGLAHMGAPAWSPRVDVWISLAGPATHLLWLAVAWPLSKWVDPGLPLVSGWVYGPVAFTLDFLVDANLYLAIFNLLPFFPMDGGRVLRALLARKLTPSRAALWAARVGQVGAVGFVVWGFVRAEAWGGILIAIGITNYFACRREVMAARYGAGPWDVQRPQPWESDPDAWRGGGTGEATGKRPGPWARWRERRRHRAAERGVEASAGLESDLDQVLDRVSEVGMAGLTKRERAVLERAAQARRRGGG